MSNQPETYGVKQLVMAASPGGTVIGVLDFLDVGKVILLDPMMVIADPRTGQVSFSDMLFPISRIEMHNGFTLFKLADMEGNMGEVLQNGYESAQIQKRTGIDLSTNHRLRKL